MFYFTPPLIDTLQPPDIISEGGGGVLKMPGGPMTVFIAGSRHDCPSDREELGRSTWTFLHTMAAYYPEQASKKQSEEMTQFIKTFSRFYPCEDCAEHMQARYYTQGRPR